MEERPQVELLVCRLVPQWSPALPVTRLLGVFVGQGVEQFGRTLLQERLSQLDDDDELQPQQEEEDDDEQRQLVVAQPGGTGPLLG